MNNQFIPTNKPIEKKMFWFMKLILVAVLFSISQNAFADDIREVKQSYLNEGIAKQYIPASIFSICKCPPRTKPDPYIRPKFINPPPVPLAIKISEPIQQAAPAEKKIGPSTAAAVRSERVSPVKPNQKFTVYFELGRSKLGFGELEQLEEILKQLPAGLKAEIEGHTCKIGGQAINDQIASARARAVKEYLVSKGIAVDRSEGQGKHGYVSKVNQLNRRVEIEIKSREK